MGDPFSKHVLFHLQKDTEIQYFTIPIKIWHPFCVKRIDTWIGKPHMARPAPQELSSDTGGHQRVMLARIVATGYLVQHASMRRATA